MSAYKGRRILYITDSLEFVGGLETRLVKQINILRSSSLEIALLTQKNTFRPSLDFINLHLDFYAPNFSDHLLSIVRHGRFDFVEFQCHGIDYISNIDLPLLKHYCKVGLAIHNEVKGINQAFINQMDYGLLAAYRDSCSTLKTKNGKDIPIIRNWVNSVSPLWTYSSQDKALFISRLDDDKFPTLKSFLQVCEAVGCDYEIAGQIRPQTIMGTFISNLKPDAYIGPVDTVRFLEKKADDYLFVGGVGQVPLEALSFGIPALVATHSEDYENSRFVVKDNFDRLLHRNFVINHFLPDYSAGNIGQFINDISTGNLDDYTDTTQLRIKCSAESAMNQYISLLDNA